MGARSLCVEAGAGIWKCDCSGKYFGVNGRVSCVVEVWRGTAASSNGYGAVPCLEKFLEERLEGRKGLLWEGALCGYLK